MSDRAAPDRTASRSWVAEPGLPTACQPRRRRSLRSCSRSRARARSRSLGWKFRVDGRMPENIDRTPWTVLRAAESMAGHRGIALQQSLGRTPARRLNASAIGR